MEKEDKSHQWNLAYFGLAAVVLGAIIGSGGSWYIWHLQQNALDEQKSLELHNIAVALSFDVSLIEGELNSTMNDFLVSNNGTEVLNDPNFIYFTNTKFYSINWIYNVFGRDISGFDGITSADLYAFYNGLTIIDDYTQFVYQINDRSEHGDKITPLDIATAHIYTKSLFAELIPDSIRLAKKINQELRQNYHTNIHLSSMSSNPTTTFYYHRETNPMKNSSSLSIKYY